ncbi:MAG: hypothetical protein AAB925_01615 [Patescibacteria group bacterium]
MAKEKLIKNITTDDLAVIMKNSFESQTKLMLDGFDKINEKMDEKFQKVNENFNKAFKTLKTMDDKLNDIGSLKHRVDYIETTLNIQPIKK